MEDLISRLTTPDSVWQCVTAVCVLAIGVSVVMQGHRKGLEQDLRMRLQHTSSTSPEYRDREHAWHRLKVVLRYRTIAVFAFGCFPVTAAAIALALSSMFGTQPGEMLLAGAVIGAAVTLAVVAWALAKSVAAPPGYGGLVSE